MIEETITTEQKEIIEGLFDVDKKIETDEDFLELCEPFDEDE